MTVRSFGQITPLQGDMLFLAGYGPSKELGVRDLVRQEGDLEIIEAIRRGAATLRKITNHDFGVSLAAWHAFLQNDSHHREEYMRPSTWGGIERAVKAEIQNPERARLEALADQM